MQGTVLGLCSAKGSSKQFPLGNKKISEYIVSSRMRPIIFDPKCHFYVEIRFIKATKFFQVIS